MAKKLSVPSEAKSKVALEKKRGENGKFVSKGTHKKVKAVTEDQYVITEEDRAAFGHDSKAFFEWALTKAATRYEASKYAKELMRFQYPTLSSTDAEKDQEVTQKVFRWEWEPITPEEDLVAMSIKDEWEVDDEYTTSDETGGS